MTGAFFIEMKQPDQILHPKIMALIEKWIYLLGNFVTSG